MHDETQVSVLGVVRWASKGGQRYMEDMQELIDEEENKLVRVVRVW